jgi:asparagine synthase (glutamine-hydrolysing)
MSGILGIINVDGAPVDPRLFRQMTDFMTYRGPDAQEVWNVGHVAFGHTMLRTTSESARERQPWSLDGRVWITADVRIDARAELAATLTSHRCQNARSANDAELILHAYAVWGEDCVDHLLGDFAFAIWDGYQRRLFCARDHFGVKPFYYACVDRSLMFSNTLNCLRKHHDVSSRLNDQALEDFLLFGLNQDPATTTYADVQRLPPAHTLTWIAGSAPSVRRYWTLPIRDPIRYKRSGDYVDHFKALLRSAVEDRLRTNRVGVFMSGGLDSPSLAATARDLLTKQGGAFDLRAYTVVHDRLIPDQERYYAGLVAEALSIPISYLVADNYELYERWEDAKVRKPEPDNDPLTAVVFDQVEQVAAHSRVAFYGEGPDNLLYYEWRPYVTELLRNRDCVRLAADVARYVLSQHRLPLVRGIPTRLRRVARRQSKPPDCPSWMNPEVATRLLSLQRPTTRAEARHIRPKAYASMASVLWQSLFETYDPGVTCFPLEVRHPYIDVRVADYLLAVPPVPWCVNKQLLREAMHGVLPESVRKRPKTPLRDDPVRARMETQLDRAARMDLSPQLVPFLQERALPRIIGQESSDLVWAKLRPINLNYWLLGVNDT